MLERDLQAEQPGIEDPQRLLEQFLPGLVPVEDDDPDRDATTRDLEGLAGPDAPVSRRGGPRICARFPASAPWSASGQQLVALRRKRRDDGLDVLVEVDPELLRAGSRSSRSTAAAKLGCFIFFLTDLAVMPVRPSGRT